MTDNLEESSKNHFIDIYNRRIALKGIFESVKNETAKYMDIGCSSGYMLEDVLKNYPNIDAYGADYYDAGLTQCHNTLPSVPLFQVDLLECPFPDSYFDAITCLNVIEHIKEDTKALSQLARILKPGGRLVVTVPAGPTLFDMYDEIHYHEKRYSLDNLIKNVENAGISILHANYFGFFIFPAFYCTNVLNKLRFGKLSMKEKMNIVMKQANGSKRLPFMEKISRFEKRIGERIRFPFGVRCYLYGTKK